MQFEIYRSDQSGNATNTVYPIRELITDTESMIQAVKFDHVCAEYKQNRRSVKNFVRADCLPMDCDNGHSDNPDDWVTPIDVATTFPEVSMTVVYSKSDMKPKGEQIPRPRFHVYFACNEITDANDYRDLKEKVRAEFPYFDAAAVDSARFYYGNPDPRVEVYDGSRTIDDYLNEKNFEQWDNAEQSVIPQGSRNSTMSHYAGRIIKRLGDTDEAYQQFLNEAKKCDPPLSDDELTRIWNSARKFGATVSSQQGYIPPDQYNNGFSLLPSDLSDVGQATVLTREYKEKLRYSRATDFIVYNGVYWEESIPKAQGLAQELTDRQLKEAEDEILHCIQEMVKNGVWAIIEQIGEKKAAESFDQNQMKTYKRYKEAEEYKKFAIKRRDSKYITASMKETRPKVLITTQELDANPFLLNTPDATYDLRLGLKGAKEHSAEDFITKVTSVSPGTEGMDLWLDALNSFFCNDAELIEYVQKEVGLAAIGKIFQEALFIAYGDGSNGKSTFWNTISHVLGSYSGSLSADVFTVGCRRNVKPEMAELKGKRFIVSAELEEGMRLNTSTVKQLCSTDEVAGEKKYKDPFKFVPSHTIVLYTNHLPKVGARDEGTWRRLIVIPFNATITGSKDIKNYSDYLVENAGGAVLSWIIEGAEKAIKDRYDISQPKCVTDAINQFHEDNDWLQGFLDECCEIDSGYMEQSGEVYQEYRSFCLRTGDFIRNTTDFYTALSSEGFIRRRTNKGSIIQGLRLKSDFLE